MIITRSTIGSFSISEFDRTAVIANDYIPLFAFQQAVVSDEGISYYSKPSLEDCLIKGNTIKNIKDAFDMAHKPRKININGRNFIIAKGVFLSESGETLMICSMKKEPFLNPSVDNFSDYYSLGKSTFSYSNYVLFYSTSFFTDPSLTALNRRLQKEMLQFCYEKGIEVRMLPSSEIEKNTFAKLFEVKKTKSLTQLEAYMAQVLPNFIHNGGEDTFVEQDFEPVVYEHEEELSVEQEALLYDSEAQPEEVPWEISRQTIEEARELAELALEAAQFDSPTIDEEGWDDEWDEAEDSVEELERQLDEEEVAHTTQTHSTDSLVERMRPFQIAYNVQMLQAQQIAEIQRNLQPIEMGPFIVRNVETSSTPNPSIELIDDTE